MRETFRKGAVGALLDEYERAISDLKKVVGMISDGSLPVILDTQTSDENCRSLQSILSHVVHSGYGYAVSIHNSKGHNLARPKKNFHLTTKEYLNDLTDVFSFTEKVFMEISEEELEQPDNSLKIKTGWGQSYDIEQLTEHAIVHILRHRRQIEKFLVNSDVLRQSINSSSS